MAILWGLAFEIKIAKAGISEFRGKFFRADVEDHMQKIFSDSGNVAVFTRDMSWAGAVTIGLLKVKAEANELSIFMQEETEKSRELVIAGANIYYYGSSLDSAINTRFTLINTDSQSIELAVGRTRGNFHRITRHSEVDDPALLIAKDMLTVFRKTLERASNEKSNV
ncbi:hypothetical protein StoSoilA2_12190 [Arthrobacter sp. StoSoilA2]|uniref:hypothetical protein n=1 Tax=Arthrobacter sp. StoSoilA2 TaxID=2830990 RepID=UPI001CC408A4|nr:hypothetical protein [Arthrobacter sp. StoSoilA2]BCW35163.1 hypothetical protein StoSoilA2_12190 [Arthrobacter sp. StoSoilA2]